MKPATSLARTIVPRPSRLGSAQKVSTIGQIVRISWLLLLLLGLLFGGQPPAAQAAPVRPQEKLPDAAFDDIGAGLPGVDWGATVWGDYDNDGDLDLLLNGYTGTTFVNNIYRNDGGVFINIGAGLPSLIGGSPAWGDYDNDGDLDLYLNGWNGTMEVAYIYRNDGGYFTNIGAALTGLQAGSAAWGDYDNDGSLDLVVSGSVTATSSFYTIIYHNNGGIFTNIGAGLTAVYNGTTSWADYDNDGDLDLLLAGGVNTTTSYTKIYRNDNGVFTDIGAALPGVYRGSSAWGDYDNDGDLDLLLTGWTGSTDIANIYRNDGGTFTNASGTGLVGVDTGSAAWGDYNNDGYLDLVITGWPYTGPYLTTVYRNTGGSFSDIGLGLPGLIRSSVAWGDYDNDGDLDLALCGVGTDGTTLYSRIYRNTSGIANTVPSAPTNLNSNLVGSTLTLTWSAASDNQTPANGLTYNVRVGTTPGGSQIVGPMANNATGYRRLPAMGNGQTGTSFILKNLPTATYYWSVQAIDGAYAGSAFAAERSTAGTYTLSGKVTQSNGSTGISGVTITANPGGQTGTSLADGTYTITGLAANTYTVTPTKSGYRFSPTYQTVAITTANATNVNFVEGVYTVSGRVTQANGSTPVSGVSVTLSPGGLNAVTATDGYYTISGVGAGSYTATPAKTGYRFTPVNRAVTVGGGSGDTANQNFSEGVYTLSGLVTLANGTTPMSGVTLTLTPGGATTVSAGAGTYSFSGLAAGSYTVTPSSGSTAFAPPSILVNLGGANGDQSGINFREGWKISGTITDGVNPLSGVLVSASGISALTDASGNYTLSGLPSGTHNVVPSKTGYNFSPANQSVTVGPNQTGINFIEGSYCVIGKVTLSDGVTGFSGVNVSIGGISTTSTGNGSYSLCNRAAGPYTISASKPGYTFLPLTRNVNLGHGSGNAINQDFQEAFKISGKVTQDGVTPISGVEVTAMPGGRSATTLADGTYIIDGLAASTYTLTPAKSGLFFSPAQRSVTVGPDQTGINFKEGYTVSGQVTDQDGVTPLAGVTVSTTPGGFSAISAADGIYSIEGVNPGSYTLTPEKSNYGFLPATLPVTVGPNQSGFNFRAGYRISGRVTLKGANAPAGFPLLKIVAIGTLDTYSAQTTADGTYSIQGLPAGTYVVRPDPAAAHLRYGPLENYIKIVGPDASGADFVASYPTYVPAAQRPIPLPGTPALNAINNPGGAGSYTVSWDAAANTTSYTLEEALSADFSGATPVCTTAGTSCPVSGKGPTRFFYRVRGSNTSGNGPYSNSQFTDVLWELEPNTTYLTANGPLLAGLDYHGYHNDQKDYFKFYLAAPGTLKVDLTPGSGNGVQLQLFFQSTSTLVGGRTGAPYSITYTGEAGWYYIYIFTESGYNTTTPYTLRVTSPAADAPGEPALPANSLPFAAP